MTESLAGPARQQRVKRARPLCLDPRPAVLAHRCAPKPEAIALLSQVLGRLHGFDVPVVQFIQVSSDTQAASVPRDFAEASLTRLGRTLLASLHSSNSTLPEAAPSSLPAAIVGRRRARRPLKNVPDIVPDAGVQGLYHVRIEATPGELSQISQVSPAIWLGEARLDFRLLVIDCGPFELNPAAVELVSRCHGSILTVAAGLTELAKVQAVAQQVQLAGGTLLGSVLYDVPPKLRSPKPTWLRRSAHVRRVV